MREYNSHCPEHYRIMRTCVMNPVLVYRPKGTAHIPLTCVTLLLLLGLAAFSRLLEVPYMRVFVISGFVHDEKPACIVDKLQPHRHALGELS
jgi:hypothetical protein